MKTSINTTSVQNDVVQHELGVEGLSNLVSLTVLTSKTDVEDFETDNYLEDKGWMDGSSYVSVSHSYGSIEEIEKIKSQLIQAVIDNGMDLDQEEQCVHAFFFVFDAGNNNHLLVTNAIEHLSYHDADFEDIFKSNTVTIFGGSLCDDADVGTTIAECFISHPWTKGFKAPGDELFEQLSDDEVLSWADYAEYNEYKFCNMDKIKKGTKFFELIEADRRLVLNNTELFPERTENDMVGTILRNLEFTKNIPDSVQLEYKHGTSNKFYNIEMNPGVCEVIIEYGAIGKTSTTDGAEFETEAEARKFYEKKVISKVKSGYSIK